MPQLREEANKLTLPSLQLGVIEVLITRGAKDVLGQVPFKTFQGESYTFNREKALPESPSVGDPYGNTPLPNGVGSRQRIAVESGMLSRNADTAKIDVIGKSDKNPQRKNDIILASKKLAEDFTVQLFHGRHDDSGTYTDYNLKGINYWMDHYESDFDEQKLFATPLSDVVAGNQLQGLSLGMVNDLLTRTKGESFDVIYSNRETKVAFMELLDAAGGNVAATYMKDNYGEPVFAYRGVRWYVIDTVGEAKVSASAQFSAGDDTVHVGDTDFAFVGFGDLDLGRAISVGGTDLGVITEVVDLRTVKVSDGAGGDIQPSLMQVERTNAIYALRFDESDGFSAVYHSNRGIPADAGEYYGPIAGFDAEDMGKLEEKPLYRTALDWYGNFVMHNPFCAARLSHFAA